MQNNFKTLLLLGRPGSGKSEIIDFLKRVPKSERSDQLHIGDFVEIDDFPMLWAWFEQDDMLVEMGQKRLFTDENRYFKFHFLWNLLIERISHEFSKFTRDNPNYENQNTVILEFSRGSEHGGYKEAFKHLSPQILENLVILYNDVSWEESLRKNKKRYNPEKPDSILEHGLSDQKLEKLYKKVDWQELASGSEGYLEIKNFKVPFVNFNNENDITSSSDEVLHSHLKSSLDKLWNLYQNK